MAICKTNCVVTLPQCYSDGCDQINRKSGISRLIFLACDVDYANLDFKLQATWDALFLAGQAVSSGLLLAEKPEGSYTEVKRKSCVPSELAGSEKNISFEEHGYESETGVNDGMGSIRFYNIIMDKPQKFLLMWYTCDGWLSEVITDFSLQADEILTNNVDDDRYVKGTVKFASKLIIESIYAPGLDLSCTAPASSSSPILP